MHLTQRPAAVLMLAACLTLPACGGGGDDETAGDEPSATTSTSTSPTPSVTLPAGVELTEGGSELAFGEAATVAYSPNQNIDGVLGLTVKDATRGRLSDFEGFNLADDYRKNANYYYVNVGVENLGTTDLGGRDVPLHGVNAANTLLPPVIFESAFKQCPTAKTPKVFAQGDTFDTCLVFLSPDKGDLTGVTFVNQDDSADSVVWKGEVQEPPAKKKKPRPQG